jgi:hypothetical protein
MLNDGTALAARPFDLELDSISLPNEAQYDKYGSDYHREIRNQF